MCSLSRCQPRPPSTGCARRKDTLCPMSMSAFGPRRRSERITATEAPAIMSGATESFAYPQDYPGTRPEFTPSYFGLDAYRPTKHFPEPRFVSGPNELIAEKVNMRRAVGNNWPRLMAARTILLALVVAFVFSPSTTNAQPPVNRPQLARQVR